MNKIISLILVIALQAFYIQNLFAGQSCYCEIGAYPTNQQKFFRTGCSLWLKDQRNCDQKKIVSQDFNYRSELIANSSISKLRIGYVGHWSGSEETVRYLDFNIIPVIKDFSVSVDIDNTACLAMKDPYYVRDYIWQQRLPANATLTFKGNQVNSVGKWDFILGPSLNLVAQASSNNYQVSFPRCLLFEGRSCLENPQSNNSGLCLDDQKKLKRLTCCQKLIDVGIGDAPSYQEKFIWSDQCQ